MKFILLPCNIEKRLDFGKQPPPCPVPQFQITPSIPLDDSDSRELLDSPLVIASGNVSSCICLEDCDDLSEFDVSFFFKMSKHACSEEDLRLTDPVAVGV